MSESEQQQTATKIAQAVNGFGELEMEHTGGCRYRVLSWRNDSLTVHKVNTSELICTCEDAAYNTDGQEVCDHVAYAVYHAPKEREVSAEAFTNLIGIIGEMNDYRNALEQRQNQLPWTDDEPADEDADTDERPSLEETTPEPSVDPAEAADELQAAFDETIDDMMVTAESGKVWFQTGRDTPDEWPFPGVEETFTAVTSPDVVEYVYEADDGPNHEWYDEKPGEWWKNALRPSDVQQYVEEVL